MVCRIITPILQMKTLKPRQLYNLPKVAQKVAPNQGLTPGHPELFFFFLHFINFHALHFRSDYIFFFLFNID